LFQVLSPKWNFLFFILTHILEIKYIYGIIKKRKNEKRK
jgi:hypothetical protein